MSQPPTRAFYLSGGSEAIYALFDGVRGPAGRPLDTTERAERPLGTTGLTPEAGETSAACETASTQAVGVLLCPLFGNDDLCAYRARREWAKTLAAAGHPTLRFDLPGTGDSAGGPHDPGRVEAWTDALASTAAWLRVHAGCARVAAIGIGLSGLLAYRAAAIGAPIDDLILWSVPARGRTFVRQLRVLSRMEASSETTAEAGVAAAKPAAEPVPRANTESVPGAIMSAGFAMSAETVASLDALDLTQLEMPDARLRRVLMLERDGLAVDERLRAALERLGANLTIAPGPGYGAMVAPPQQSQAPREVFASVGRWLAESPPTPATPTPTAEIAITDALDLSIEGVHVRELPMTIAHGEGRLTGVLAEPDGTARFCAVLLNAGALRHIGPNRMWVETARRWAARGVPTLRIDLAGIGDADGDASALESDEGFYLPSYVEQTHEVLAALSERELPSRFVLCGLCSGAYWALHAALEDERVRGAFMVNPRALFWDPSIDGVREARNVRKAFKAQTWRKLLRGQIERERIATIARGVGVALATLPARARKHRGDADANTDRLDRALIRIDSTGVEILAVFTAGEPVLEELVRDGALQRMRSRPTVRVESIPGPTTSHTLEPLALQSATHTLLDDALARLLDRQTDTDRTDTGHERPLSAGGA